MTPPEGIFNQEGYAENASTSPFFLSKKGAKLITEHLKIKQLRIMYILFWET